MNTVTALKKKSASKPTAIERLKPLFAPELEQVNEEIRNLTKSEALLIPQLAEHLIASGGKRLRPVLTILSAKLCGYEKGRRHIRLAAAIEFIHSATLLHDDVVDESDLRRGAKTANNIWGNPASVLVGDFLLSRAFQLMARDGSMKVLKLLSDSSAIISEGEVWQLMATADLATTKETYLKIIGAKTAQLFAAACGVGALISGRSDADVAAMENYGRSLGVAFQIVDDALDYSAKQEELGKSIGDDFSEGKVTLPVLIAYAKAVETGDKKEQAFWNRVIVDLKQQQGDLEQAVALMQKHDVLKAVMDEARAYAKTAKDSLKDFRESPEKQAMIDLADFAVDRVY